MLMLELDGKESEGLWPPLIIWPVLSGKQFLTFQSNTENSYKAYLKQSTSTSGSQTA